MKNGRKVLTLSTAIYPLETIYAACYSLLDRAYFYLDGDPQSKVQVSIKDKEGSAAGKGGDVADAFLNELLHHALRHKIVQANQKVREHIITQALVSSQPSADLTPDSLGPLSKQADGEVDKDLEKEIEKLLAEVEKQGGPEDPLQIAVPWEEKYQKGKKAGKEPGPRPAGSSGDRMSETGVKELPSAIGPQGGPAADEPAGIPVNEAQGETAGRRSGARRGKAGSGEAPESQTTVPAPGGKRGLDRKGRAGRKTSETEVQ